MLNDLSQYPFDKQLEVTDANLAMKKQKITSILEAQDHIYLCPMQLDSLVYSQKTLEKPMNMNICLHMTTMLIKMWCS